MKRKTLRLAALAAAVLLMSAVVTAPVLAAQDERIEISCLDDLLEFSHNCSLDSWSRGKTFVLTSDIDLVGESFTPVPSFGGVFLGEGHRITNLRLNGGGSDVGLFRFVQEGAVIRSLSVTGVVEIENGSGVGALAGSSAGFIEDCSFSGVVGGESSVGGLVGINEESGEISGCTVSGIVSGDTAAGGVVGKNLGVVIKCENSAEVNTSVPEGLTGGAGGALENLVSPEESETGIFGHTDSGGIAGYSSGVLQSCRNLGSVGYPHSGYNVGGIAGRQIGFLSGCVNYGDVKGRKDVGGIVGQAEPDILPNMDEDALARLRTEIENLNSLISGALNDADAGREDISRRLDAVGGSAGDVGDSAERLARASEGFANSNIKALNTLGAALTSALDGLDGAFDALSDASDGVDALCLRASDALDRLADAEVLLDDGLADASAALSRLQSAGAALKTASGDMKTAAGAMQNAVIIHDYDALLAAVKSFAEGVRNLGSALRSAEDALSDLHTALEGTLPDPNGVGGALAALGTAIGSAGDALEQTGAALETIYDNAEIDWAEVETALASAESSLDSLGTAGDELNAAFASLESALNSLRPYASELGGALEIFSDALGEGSEVGASLASAFDQLGTAVSDFRRDGSVSLTPVTDEMRESGGLLYSSLGGLSDSLEELKSASSGVGDALSSDIRAINDSGSRIFSLLLDAIDDARTPRESEPLFGDASEDNIYATRLGKAEGCVNLGSVDGDRNVGGVAGSVAVEYDLDPEDDAARLTFGKTYELKAILQSCVNRGAVNGKRDCVGGVTGRMDLGTAINCRSFGSVSGDSYVGGVAGYADASVRGSWVKCEVSGREYVGGVAGWVRRMTDCRAIANVSGGDMYVGSVAGSAELDGLSGNYFLDMGLAAVDGVSYSGAAEPIDFYSLRSFEGAPEDFRTFTLTFSAGGEVIERLRFDYGEDLSGLELPEIPEVEGCYGFWPEFDTSGLASDISVEAVYSPWLELIESPRREGRLALALAEGRFTDSSKLDAQTLDIAPPEGVEDADVLSLSLTGADVVDGAPIRLLNRFGKGARVWRLDPDGAWRRITAEENGSYLRVAMDGDEGVFCIAAAHSSLTAYAAAAAAVVAAVLAAIIILIRRKSAKKRHSK